MPKSKEDAEADRAFAQRFGPWFAQKSADKSVAELSSAAGVSQAAIYSYRGGVRCPNLRQAVLLMRASGVESLELHELLSE